MAKNWLMSWNISWYSGPIFAIFSPYESALHTDDGSVPYFPICQGMLPWQPNNFAVIKANWYYMHSLHVCQMVARFFLLGGDTVAPSGLYPRLCHAFLVYLFNSENNYFRIYWTNFRNFFTEWKRFGCRWSIWTSFFLISQETLPLQPIFWKNGKLPSFFALAYAVVMCLCVCVCLSVTLRNCIKTVKHRITKIMLYDSPLTLVFWHQRFTAKFERDHCLWWRQMQVGWVTLAYPTPDNNVTYTYCLYQIVWIKLPLC